MRLTRTTLGSWFEEVRAEAPYPELVVVDDTRDVIESSLPGVRELPSLVDHDPGCYLFYVDETEAEHAQINADREPLSTDRAASLLEEAAAGVGRRFLVEVDTSQDDSEKNDAFNRLAAPPDATGSRWPELLLRDGRAIPSLGPGGHVAVEDRNGTVTGTASVRPFVEVGGIEPAWVSTDLVLQPLAPFLDGDVEFFPEVGYYEKSWMERQGVISPRLVFVLEWRDADLYSIRQEIVLPATLAGD